MSDEKSKGTVLCAQLSRPNLQTFQNFDDDATVSATVNTDVRRGGWCKDGPVRQQRQSRGH